MKTEELKISLAQRILSIDNDSILEQINDLLNKENIVAYNRKGIPIYRDEYVKELDKLNNEIDNGTAVLLSSEAVKNKITNEHNLAS